VGVGRLLERREGLHAFRPEGLTTL
jgi:hypothetical protein